MIDLILDVWVDLVFLFKKVKGGEDVFGEFIGFVQARDQIRGTFDPIVDGKPVHKQVHLRQ